MTSRSCSRHLNNVRVGISLASLITRAPGFPVMLFRPMLSSRQALQSRKNTDIILTTMPKFRNHLVKKPSLFPIANRDVFPIDQSPLLTSNPHTLVPFLEYNVYREQENPDFEHIPTAPRIFSTHMPFGILPDSIR
ncbi:Cytosolic sulfotransferase 14 [Sesamum alatum]|uniref:Sulfotransferase n=1 Tax=Sesamum alatum TaxID=300844 RepID=A0AAE1Y2C7_9LAMI|nr:Cytosolic sulfotransferase 14 [Sesamum alatum]